MLFGLHLSIPVSVGNVLDFAKGLFSVARLSTGDLHT